MRITHVYGSIILLSVAIVAVAAAWTAPTQGQWQDLSLAEAKALVVADTQCVKKVGQEEKCAADIVPCPNGWFTKYSTCTAAIYKDACTSLLSDMVQPDGTLVPTTHDCSEFKTRQWWHCTCNQGAWDICSTDCVKTGANAGWDGCPGTYITTK